jgi:hypothetical protein
MFCQFDLLVAALSTLQQYVLRGAEGVVPEELRLRLSVLLCAICALGDGRSCGCPLRYDEESGIIAGYGDISEEIDRAVIAISSRDKLSANYALRKACEYMYIMRQTVLAAQRRRPA